MRAKQLRGARRDAVRRLTSGVTVLTVAHRGLIHGTTVSSAFAVSRDQPMVGVCLRRGSQFAELALADGRFAVNVLSRRQALLADWFANPDRPSGPAQFEFLDWEPDPLIGAPLLGGALATMRCRVTGSLPVGDHDLHLAEVLAGSVAEMSAPGRGSPLVSIDGGLHGAELHEVARRRGWRTGTGAPATALD